MYVSVRHTSSNNVRTGCGLVSWTTCSRIKDIIMDVLVQVRTASNDADMRP